MTELIQQKQECLHQVIAFSTGSISAALKYTAGLARIAITTSELKFLTGEDTGECF